jgi:hypothetical protein
VLLEEMILVWSDTQQSLDYTQLNIVGFTPATEFYISQSRETVNMAMSSAGLRTEKDTADDAIRNLHHLLNSPAIPHADMNSSRN